MTEISEHLKAALVDVHEAEIPESLLPLAFKEALRLRAGEGLAPGSQGQSRATAASAPQVSGEGGLSDIAARFGVDAAMVSEVFVERDGEIHLGIGAKAIAAGKATGTKEIGLLIVGARQAAGVEDWTSVNVIRDEVKHYGKYDQSNFGKTVTEMEDLFQFSGKGQGREVKMRQPAWEAAGALVQRLVGGE